MRDYGLDLAVIGNGRTAALVNPEARLVWWCFPRFDSDPVFSRLLAGDEEKGFTDVILADQVESSSQYERNTATVATILTASNGAAVKITDFAPRYRNYGRISHPPQIVRMIEPVAGIPHVTIRVRPTHDYGNPVTNYTLGSNHIRYTGGATTFRLTTDAPLSYIEREAPFVLRRGVYLVFGPDEPFPAALPSTCRDWHERTTNYWLDWVRRLGVAVDWQDEVIRAAIALKLANFEETGAVIAAHTTSIPEAPGSGRTWDYRFCWLRDAYFVVKALNRVGATQVMEDFINYTLGIAATGPQGLRPVYSIVPTEPLDEHVASNLAGYRGNGPVRIGNAAALQSQNDVYGSIILSAVPMFFDRRLPSEGDPALFHLLERHGEEAARLALEPDAGIWEYRGKSRVHTHSAAVCWAGCNRLGAIAAHLGNADRAQYWNDHADRIGAELLERAWSPKRKAFTAAFGSDDLDASVLLLPELGLVEPNDERYVSTVSAIERELLKQKHLMRYIANDDFGAPETAFLVCKFWLIDAWWAMGRKSDARDLFRDAMAHRNHYGLLSEDIEPGNGALWGNIPQTYSMAGLILSAMRLSRSWEDRYWRASS